jgi:hypothetical protein
MPRGIALVPTAVMLLAAACGGPGEGASAPAAATTYPLVTETGPGHQPAVTTADGAVVSLPALPAVYEVAPSPSCERVLATFHDGSNPARRPIVVPPAPGLRAQAISERTVRIEWWFESLPEDCRPQYILLAIRAGRSVRATPTTKQFRVAGAQGSTEITYPDFLPPPDVAFASALTDQGRRSRTATVLITR